MDFARSSICLKASTVLTYGFGAPARGYSQERLAKQCRPDDHSGFREQFVEPLPRHNQHVRSDTSKLGADGVGSVSLGSPGCSNRDAGGLLELRQELLKGSRKAAGHDDFDLRDRRTRHEENRGNYLGQFYRRVPPVVGNVSSSQIWRVRNHNRRLQHAVK